MQCIRIARQATRYNGAFSNIGARQPTIVDAAQQWYVWRLNMTAWAWGIWLMGIWPKIRLYHQYRHTRQYALQHGTAVFTNYVWSLNRWQLRNKSINRYCSLALVSTYYPRCCPSGCPSASHPTKTSLNCYFKIINFSKITHTKELTWSLHGVVVYYILYIHDEYTSWTVEVIN